MLLKYADRMVNSAYPDQTAPLGTLIWVYMVYSGLSVQKLRNITLPSPDVEGPGSVFSPPEVPGASELSAPVFSGVVPVTRFFTVFIAARNEPPHECGLVIV